ncbi:type II-A CRISPR-associated protein Csn2 [Levilactobacillus hammesii]|uniref:CRISPR-associated protein, SAG0897 family n=1 Tax=Levilactobacillus hammesii DSM 16381 TaxID=1423753 RepID=A0A0R1UUM1_9LACO|nr:type II-A CRISPR-associated protein Csn2 [Levilactobacillus hammesii]KRL93739.1 CRISPR-associated protein, SAG0897 family [Levilactobacillus hammesii DSM 16381]
MNFAYYSFPPFAVRSSKVTVVDTAVQRIYQDLSLGFQDKLDTVKLSDDSFDSVTVKNGAQWYGDPMLTVDLNSLFQRKLQTQLIKLLADDQVVALSDGLRELLSKLLEDSYLMDVPLEMPEIPELAKLVKFSGIQVTTGPVDNAYAIIESLIKVLIELNDKRMLVLTNVSHYLQVSQLQSLVRFMANTDLPLLLIEFSSSQRKEYFTDCDYHYIDSDFVLW